MSCRDLILSADKLSPARSFGQVRSCSQASLDWVSFCRGWEILKSPVLQDILPDCLYEPISIKSLFMGV